MSDRWQLLSIRNLRNAGCYYLTDVSG